MRRAVLDHHRLPQVCGHEWRKQSCNDITGAARRKRDDQLDRLSGPGLRVGAQRKKSAERWMLRRPSSVRRLRAMGSASSHSERWRNKRAQAVGAPVRFIDAFLGRCGLSPHPQRARPGTAIPLHQAVLRVQRNRPRVACGHSPAVGNAVQQCHIAFIVGGQLRARAIGMSAGAAHEGEGPLISAKS